MLLPVRNGEEDLPGWFDAVRGLADVVIALDDGSTDDTPALLGGEPLVRAILARPPRPTAAGWDDALNRQQLLEAADEVRPRWVLFLDADERIDADDAAALRAFLGSDDADRGAAYAFLVHRMTGAEAFDRADLWVHRLFAWRPGLLLPERRLHLVPVPVSIPPGRWRQTSVRIRHLASLTSSRAPPGTRSTSRRIPSASTRTSTRISWNLRARRGRGSPDHPSCRCCWNRSVPPRRRRTRTPRSTPRRPS